ncbi:MAG TPA: hypothetical protein VF384_19040 [Planctomycetota bacterium]
MWLWIALGWVALAVTVAVLHHRMRRGFPSSPPGLRSFTSRLQAELAAAHPGVKLVGMLPNRLVCLLRVDGQETPVGLQSALRHHDAPPDAFSRMVARLIADIRELGLDRVSDVDFAAAAPLLLPQVRSRAWLDEQGSFGDSALVHTPINDQLVTVYVIDERDTMVFVCRGHIKSWRKTTADVHNLALTNLARLGTEQVRAASEAKQPTVLQSGDGLDAARVLLLDQSSGLLVAVPDRDTLWVGPEAGQNIEQLMTVTEAISEQSAHPVSPQVWRLTDGRLEALSATR